MRRENPRWEYRRETSAYDESDYRSKFYKGKWEKAWIKDRIQYASDKKIELYDNMIPFFPIKAIYIGCRMPRDRKKFFDTSKYKSYLVSNNEKVKYIFENFLVDKWLREDRKLNNYVHANGIRFVMDNYVYQNKKEDKHKELIETLQNITDIFLSLLSVIDSIKFHSSDYLDALEMEMKPQEGSQYWVCPIIVEYMNDRFDKKLLQYIQNNEGNGMQFMAEYYNQNKG